MKNKVLALLFAGVLACAVLTSCGKTETKETTAAQTEAQTEAETKETEAVTEVVTEAETKETEAETAAACELEDGEYTAEFKTDSSMFHTNEACDGKSVLTVANGKMTIHVSLVSKNIVNLYVGLAEDAKKDGAVVLEPTIDEVTYSDNTTEEVYGFDIPVEKLDEEFDLAVIGKKDKWYDHKVSVSLITE